MTLKVFTYWEGENKPPYLDLCLKTFITHNIDLIVLNHQTVFDYIEESAFDFTIFKTLPCSMQSDIVSVFVLNRHRGIFIDIDTIIFENFLYFEKYLEKKPLVMIGQHLSFLMSDTTSLFLKEWEREIIERMPSYPSKEVLVYAPICFFGNEILFKLSQDSTLKEDLLILNRKPFFLEGLLDFGSSGGGATNIYKQVYFSDYLILDECTILSFDYITVDSPFFMLHNSWTPLSYKSFSEEDLLSDSTILSKLLRYALSLSNDPQVPIRLKDKGPITRQIYLQNTAYQDFEISAFSQPLPYGLTSERISTGFRDNFRQKDIIRLLGSHTLHREGLFKKLDLKLLLTLRHLKLKFKRLLNR